MKSSRLFLFLVVALAAQPATAAIDASLLAGLEARAIGPAGMSGRVAAVVVDPEDPNSMLVGASTGGLWKSADAGLTWDPLFDEQPVASIGAVALDPHNPDVIWVGTGEGNLRNSTSVGNGVYRSLDGGRTWVHLGLEESERIHRILVHPHDPNTVWVAAVGRLWGDGEQRGVFRTVDGGRSWQKVLYVDERTGCADLVLDPTNPDKLFAAMYDHRREPWFYTSGGSGSGLYRSVDGGDTWTRLEPEDGMPEGDLGRIGVTVAPSDPRVVYALVEAKENVLLRSDDGGWTWKDTGARENVGNRPFYYADLRVDPERPGRVYSLWSLISVSDDYGKSFRVLVPFNEAHPDHHAMWIHPEDGRFVVIGNDGGVYISHDRAQTWRFVPNLPVGQFYHVAVDDDLPYHVYGGMQDNGSWRGPSEVWENGGIRNPHWQEVSFGDGFDTRPMADDSTRGYSMSQEGYLYRWDVETGEVRSIRPAEPGEERLRFNWNAGLALDPFDPAGLYYGSQFLHHSADRGETWTVLSEDLTTDRAEWQRWDESGGLTPDVTGAENFTSIVAIAPSPHEEGTIWVGTDDGRLHLTRDGGRTWESAEGRVKGVPANTWIPHIAVSPHDPGTAFVVFDNHRRSDLTPYVQRTTDYGRNWRSLATDEIDGYCLVIEQDPVDPDLLYLGTEFGLYLSLDAGRGWMKWTHGVPTVSVMDLTVQRRENDLVLGTHGRSIFVLDDVTPLRELTEEVMSAPLHLFPISDAQQYWVQQSAGPRFPGATEFRGPNPPYGALISFVANGEQLPHPDEELEKARKVRERAEATARRSEEKEAPADPEGDGEKAGKDEAGTKVEIEVLDAEGGRVRSFEQKAHRGLNRIAWNLRSDPFRAAPSEEEDFFGGGTGPEVPPGDYTVVLRLGEHEVRQPVRVLADPRMEISAADRAANWEARQRAGAVRDVLAEALHRVVETRRDVDTVLDRIQRHRQALEARGEEWEDDQKPLAGLEKQARELREELGKLEKELRNLPDAKGIPGGETPWGLVGRVEWFLGSSWDRPTPTVLEHLLRAERMSAGALESANAFFAEKLPGFRDNVNSTKELQLFSVGEPLALPEP